MLGVQNTQTRHKPMQIHMYNIHITEYDNDGIQRQFIII